MEAVLHMIEDELAVRRTQGEASGCSRSNV